MSTQTETPLAGRILADWLRLLGRTGRWDEFEAEVAQYAGEDLDIVCYGLQSRVRRSQAAFIASVPPSNWRND